MHIKNWLIFFVVSTPILIAGCQGGGSAGTSQSTAAQIQTYRYRDGMVCQEYARAPFQHIGIQCICSNMGDSGNYSYSSRRPGYATECKSPTAWAAEQDRLAAQRQQVQREEEAANRKTASERDRLIREGKAELQALKPYCPALAQRFSKIKQMCATAGNPAHCENVRSQSIPFPAPFSRMSGGLLESKIQDCRALGFYVTDIAPDPLGTRNWRN